MRMIGNILVGFFVSFVGSIPLGYLNIIGFEIHSVFGFESMVLFLLGVVFIEVFVIYFTLIFANRLVENKRIMKAIDIFGIVFLLFLGFSFYSHASMTAENHNYLEKYKNYSPFLIGVFLSSINFLQFPFWTAWNLYLINNKYISVSRPLQFFYVGGTLLGTFAGMVSFIFFLDSVSQNSGSVSKYLMPIIIPLFFIVLACAQGYKVFKKYIR
jgi:threonine/homoserine/homoserine lactone efflux protein